MRMNKKSLTTREGNTIAFWEAYFEEQRQH